MDERRAVRLSVSGAVQGVGFRPFVHRLASSLCLAGEVKNTSSGVDVVVEGSEDAVAAFLRRLTSEAPPLSLLESVVVAEAMPTGRTGFAIVPSPSGSPPDTLVTADAATCPDCLRELLDPSDRRFRYPFINCTNCGPRFTITLGVPYDRRSTTMAGFTMCPQCLSEYNDPGDRRFHAQPNACPACGPRLRYTAGARDSHGDAALGASVALLRRGGILALKGLGGYHLACDALDDAAVAHLRTRKQRDERPFAVMVESVHSARHYCRVSALEEELLTSTRRPIVLLQRDGRPLAEGIAPGMNTYGLFLPYTPLHHLLLLDFAAPLVMTSGNLSDEPIAYDDGDAIERLAPLADGFLTHDRPIHMRTDDSVTRVFDGAAYPQRRARGYTPLPVAFSGSQTRMLAVGGHLKNTFCLTRGDRAFVSHHIGDLDNLLTVRSLEAGVRHFEELFGLTPELVVHDLHPDYQSTRFAQAYAAARSLPVLAVQHHEAHVASVAADRGYEGPLVGVAFDGAGYGPDGTIWGGEVFVGEPGHLIRAAHLGHLRLPGGDRAVREPWRLALALADLHAAEAGRDPDALPSLLQAVPGGPALLQQPWEPVRAAMSAGINAPLTSSAGRLFDAVSSLLGFAVSVSYEGQAAVLLEAAALRAAATHGLPHKLGTGPWAAPPPTPNTPRVIPLETIAAGLWHDLAVGKSPDEVALRFHLSLAALTAGVVVEIASSAGVETVALGGGVFQNMLLLRLLTQELKEAGLRVLTHRNVPTNDGGLCLGQAEIAARLVKEARV